MSTDVPEDRAVIDRIVDGHAVLHVGADAVEETIPAERLPADAKEGDWLHLTRRDSGFVVGPVDEEMTRRRRRDLSARMDALRRQRRGGRFS